MFASFGPESRSASKPTGANPSHVGVREASARRRQGHGALPDEIAFLSAYGAPSAALVEAVALSRRLGVSPVAALLSSGVVTDTAYYESLARRLGLPFVAALPNLAAIPGELRASGAPVARLPDGDRYLVAPQGESLRALLEMRQAGRAPPARLAITTPRRLATWTRAASARTVARAACEELRRFDPALSAATPLSRPLRAGLALAALVGGGAGLAGGALWLTLSGALGALAAAAVALRLMATAAALNAPERRAPELPDHRLPTYTIIAPLYKEAGVVARLASALNALDYPSAKLDVKLVVEADDHETRAAIEALGLPDRFETVIAPPGAPRTKPRAMNVALPAARGSLIVVFDAEDAPEPTQLRRAAERFAVADGRLACLQARLVIDNTGDGWLAALFGIEYAALFDVLNIGLAELGAPMMLGGTSNHFRAAALRRLRGWDAWNVTEDADLGLRLARFGYRVETIDSVTHEEIPARLRAWVAQRRRWIKGWIQTLLVHGRAPARVTRELGPAKAAIAFAMLANGVFGPMLGPIFAILMLRDAIWGDLLAPKNIAGVVQSASWISLAGAGAISMMWPIVLGILRRGLAREAGWLVLLPAYHVLLAFAAWGALFDLWRTPFVWAKTSHGLAKTSRRATTAK